jgi:ABC-type multidrug transport system ATPase subunit/pSer/pThr/pTyr-binding forkhead associated (FHA) protein
MGIDTADPRRAAGHAPAMLLHAGRRIPVAGEVKIGRLADNDVVLASDSVSRHHACIRATSRGYAVTDLRSRNGTRLNGERFHGQTRLLANGDTVQIGGEALRFLTGDETRYGGRQPTALRTRHIQFPGERLTVGRDPSNDVVLDDPNVSRFHAEIVRSGERVELRDLGSRNGTRVNGSPAPSAILAAGSEIGIGSYRLIFDGDSFVARAEQGALRLDAESIVVRVKSKQILAPLTISIAPGEFVAIIGESGAGKSTLIRALAGVTPVTEGAITVNAEPVTSRSTDIGYLPQDEIVHGKLSVREALGYSARLRLPNDTTPQELEATVARVLDEMQLSEHADTRIESLSGGQRKRVGLATELLRRPSLLFLDEPTTGLDPALETRMMLLLRELADHSRAVLLVTHATKNLAVCGRLIVMGRGGILCFEGSPEDALEFFGAETYDDIYVQLDRRPAIEWHQRYLDRQARVAAGEPDAAAPELSTAGEGRGRRRTGAAIPQALVLTSRYAKLFLRDRRNVLILLAQVPVLALAVIGLFNIEVFARRAEAGEAVKLLFLVVTVAVWLGTIDSAREIVKERSVFAREYAVGVRLGSYLFSKVAVLFTLVAGQIVLLTGIVFAFQPLHAAAGRYGLMTAILVVTGFAAVAMGLTMSALVRTQDQATSFIPLLLIPQMFFGGSIVPVATMSAGLAAVSKVVIAQWSYAGVGSTAHLGNKIAADKAYAKVSRFGTDYFAISQRTVFLVIAGIMAAFLALTAILLQRRASAQ